MILYTVGELVAPSKGVVLSGGVRAGVSFAMIVGALGVFAL